jgi:hypothetical protein
METTMETRDAPFPTTIHLNAKHCQDADRAKPGSCILADAIKDETHCTVDPVVGSHTIKIVKDGVEYRYDTPSSVSKVIRQWDRDKKGKLGISMWARLIARGAIVLHPPRPSERKGARTKRKNSWKENPNSDKSGQTQHGGHKLNEIVRRTRRAGSAYDPNAGVPVGQTGMTYADRVLSIFKARKGYKASEIIQRLSALHMDTHTIYHTLSKLVKQGKLVRPARVYHLAP